MQRFLELIIKNVECDMKIKRFLHQQIDYLRRQPFPGIEIVRSAQREVSRDGAARGGFRTTVHNLNFWNRQDAQSTRARVKIAARHRRHSKNRKERHSLARQRKKRKRRSLISLLPPRVACHRGQRISRALAYFVSPNEGLVVVHGTSRPTKK